MSDEIIEFKPGVGPLKLNVVALLKRLSSKAKNDPVAVVAHRFLMAFRDHNVPVTQIPRLLPQLSLDKLSKAEILLSALSNDVLEKTASLFGIRREWLDGVGKQIYDKAWCYKAPERFFLELANLDMRETVYPIVAFCCDKHLNGHDEKNQPLVLILREKICDLGDEVVHRYRIFDDGWDWGYSPCRIQLKAMARVVDKVLSKRIPIYQIGPKVLSEIGSGHRVPRGDLQRPACKNMSLEDFGLSPTESAQSKEFDELPHVIEYINFHGLENAARRALSQSTK